MAVPSAFDDGSVQRDGFVSVYFLSALADTQMKNGSRIDASVASSIWTAAHFPAGVVTRK
jgi:hypothetical protein